MTGLDRSIAFYSEIFGLDVDKQFTFENEKLAFLRLGTQRLELIESAAQRGAGVVDHVALEVADLDALMVLLRQRGVVLLDAEPVEVAELQARIAFCLGPDGERIELVEPARKPLELHQAVVRAE